MAPCPAHRGCPLARAALLMVLAVHCLAGCLPSSAGWTTKRGLGVTPAIAPALQKLHPAWCYNWSLTPPASMPPDVEFVPMAWGWSGEASAQALVAQGRRLAGTPLLGFNEPDGAIAHGGCHLSVAVCLDAWPALVATGARLGSPACVHDDDRWMHSFMAGAAGRGLRVDFVAVHWYGDADAGSLLGTLRRIHRLYQRPLWLTEFAPADWRAAPRWSSRISPEDVARFMLRALPALDRCDYVERYAWFSASPDDPHLGVAALVNKDGTLTECGRIYAGLKSGRPTPP